MSRLRVALVGPGFPPQVGGIEICIARLADELASLGCDVEVLVQTRHVDETAERTQLLPSGVTVRRFPSWTHSRRFPLAPSLVTHIRRSSSGYDVVHGHNFHAAPAPLAALLSNKPFVFSPYYHGDGHTRLARLAHKPYAPVGERAFQRASVVLVNSQCEADLVQRDFGMPASRVRVLHPGIDVADISTAEPYPTNVPTVLLAGRLEEYKQVHLAIKAMALVPEPVRMAIVGTGPCEPYLKRLASSLAVAPRVRFLGQVPTHVLYRWYKTCRVFLSLSRHESFGISLMEAIAGGASVVATAIPASAEIAQLAGTKVHFVPVDASPEHIADALRAAFSSRGETADLLRLPSWHSRAEECLRIYREVMPLSPSPLLAS